LDSQSVKHHLAQKSIGQTPFSQRVNLSNIIWPKSQLDKHHLAESQLVKHHLAKKSIGQTIVGQKSITQTTFSKKSNGQTSFGQRVNWSNIFWPKSQFVKYNLAKSQ
jgi:hypothetical protein